VKVNLEKSRKGDPVEFRTNNSKALSWLTLVASLCLFAFSPQAGAEGTESKVPYFKIDYSYFCGLPNRYESRKCSLDGWNMNAQEASKVWRLIGDSSLLAVKEKDVERLEGGPQYSLSVCTGAVTVSVNWGGEHRPKSLSPLISYMEEHAEVKKVGIK
jgi:hypothetical protein